MKLQTVLIGFASSFLLLLLFSCGGAYLILRPIIGGRDDWRHYEGGGMFGTDSPSLSDDEAQFVFAAPTTGHGDIYITEVPSAKAKRLTATNDCDLSPHFLPNSQQILFQREQPPYRHIWLMNLQNGEQRQLTRGMFTDHIASVSPTGSHVLVLRSTNWRLTDTSKLYLLDVGSETLTELKSASGEVFYGSFAEQGASAVIGWHGSDGGFGFELASLDGGQSRPIARGTLYDVCDDAGIVVAASEENEPSPPNQNLWSYDLVTGERERIGHGHSARAFANGKVLYFVGYEHQAMIWQKGATPREIDSPPGYKVRPNRSVKGNTAVLFIMPPQQPDRLYDIWLFDAQTEQFNQVKVTLPAK